MENEQLLFDYSALDSEARVVIKQKTNEIRTLVKSTAESILHIGQKLYEVKEEMMAMRDRLKSEGKNISGHPNTSFDSWLSTEFGWSRASAYNFIKVYKAFGESDNIGEIAASALYLLAGAPDSARERALKEAEKGERISRAKATEIVSTAKSMDQLLPSVVPETVVVTTDGTKATVKENTGRSLFLEYEDGSTEAVPATGGWIREIVPQTQECQWYEDDTLLHPTRPVGQGFLEDVPYCLYPLAFKDGGQLYGIQIQIGEDIISCRLEEAKPLGFWKAEAITYLNANKELFVLEALPIESPQPKKPAAVNFEWKKDDIVRVEGEGLGRILAVFPTEGKATVWLDDKSEAFAVPLERVGKPFHLFEDKAPPPKEPENLAVWQESGMGDEGEYYTPLVLIDAVKRFFFQVVNQEIDLDPASHFNAQQTIRARKIFTRVEDGLKQDWACRTLFLNPPYQGIELWIDKLLAEWQAKSFSEGIILVPSKTETAWYQKLLGNMRGVCFPTTLFLSYRHSDGSEAIPFSCSLVYLGGSYFSFCEIFTPYGLILH